ncbi:MAG TPA: YdjY domain-containing protein [Methylomirabilota bacterium]|jgi:hypothetical protein|nr:YdjY domain-containing protein [Methylomirabilota bacterium]
MLDRRALLFLGALVLAAEGPVDAQPAPAAEPKIEKLGDGLLGVGKVRVDLEKRQVAVPGVVTPASTLEFVAGTKGGAKGYETALELDTDAVGFNLALILIGLDKANAVPSRRHFDPRPPEGDPVEIWVEWQEPDGARRVRAEDLIYNTEGKKTLPRGPWVYTGSVFLRNGRYLADFHGVLIGFVHTPAPVIENPSSDGVARYGSFKINPELNLKPGTPVRVTVTAVPKP